VGPKYMATDTAPQHWHDVPSAPAQGAALARLADLADGQVTMLELLSAGSAGVPFRYLLLRSGPQVKAYVNRCAHFGVPLAARQDLLIFKPHATVSCNVHYARYRWSDGVCEAGDCVGESLLAIPVVVDAHGSVCIAGGSAVEHGA
jgi:nitrite reductase/ring-hydroxylating ferredoxin subunit